MTVSNSSNIDSFEQLKSLKPYEFDSVSILAGSGGNVEQIDAKTLTLLLELRKIFKDYTAETGNEVTTDLIAEIINSEETDLVIKAGVKDFLLSNQLVSKILAQVSQEPDVMEIYRDLFSADGRELYMLDVGAGFPIKFHIGENLHKPAPSRGWGRVYISCWLRLCYIGKTRPYLNTVRISGRVGIHLNNSYSSN